MKAICLALLLPLVVVAAPLPDTSREDLRSLEGEWAIVTVVWNGDDSKGRDEHLISIKGDRLEWKCPPASGMVYRIRCKGGTIDLIPQSGPLEGRTLEGICKLEGETLLICHSSSERDSKDKSYDRPTKFKSPAESYRLFFTLKRKIQKTDSKKTPK